MKGNERLWKVLRFDHVKMGGNPAVDYLTRRSGSPMVELSTQNEACAPECIEQRQSGYSEPRISQVSSAYRGFPPPTRETGFVEKVLYI